MAVEMGTQRGDFVYIDTVIIEVSDRDKMKQNIKEKLSMFLGKA